MIDHDAERLAFSRSLDRHLSIMFNGAIVILVLFIPMMIICAFIAADQEPTTGAVEAEDD